MTVADNKHELYHTNTSNLTGTTMSLLILYFLLNDVDSCMLCCLVSFLCHFGIWTFQVLTSILSSTSFNLYLNLHYFKATNNARNAQFWWSELLIRIICQFIVSIAWGKHEKLHLYILFLVSHRRFLITWNVDVTITKPIPSLTIIRVGIQVHHIAIILCVSLLLQCCIEVLYHLMWHALFPISLHVNISSTWHDASSLRIWF